MAITVHQSATFASSSDAITFPVNFATTPTVGRMVVVMAQWNTGFSAFATEFDVADNQGNTYTRRSGQNWGAQGARIYTAPIGTASGTFTVTASFTGAEAWATGPARISIAEISGHDSTTPIDEAGAANGTGTTASVALATMSADTVVFAACGMVNGYNLSGLTGWTVIYNTDGNRFASFYRTGDYDPSVTISASDDWVIAAAGINASGGGGSSNGAAFHYYRQQQ